MRSKQEDFASERGWDPLVIYPAIFFCFLFNTVFNFLPPLGELVKFQLFSLVLVFVLHFLHFLAQPKVTALPKHSSTCLSHQRLLRTKKPIPFALLEHHRGFLHKKKKLLIAKNN